MDLRLAGLEKLGNAAPFVALIHSTIGHIRLFEDFDADEIAEVAGYLECYRAPAGTEIIAENEQGDFMLLVLDGTMEILRQGPDGLPVRIGLAGPGKTLGEMSLIDGEPRFASCISLRESTFGVLDRASLSQIIADKPRLGVKLMMQLLILVNQRLRLVSAELVSRIGSTPQSDTLA
ncbi:MAG TPA: cyclic nucleotide-binding domain-containing protein [Rhodocyclaceae bacterium]|jgi:CRP-like cAMP-binding protein|nr:cyclic nucleotide-binding domain-containing protein [Rhodocyclaceae bacterium]